MSHLYQQLEIIVLNDTLLVSWGIISKQFKIYCQICRNESLLYDEKYNANYLLDTFCLYKVAFYSGKTLQCHRYVRHAMQNYGL